MFRSRSTRSCGPLWFGLLFQSLVIEIGLKQDSTEGDHINLANEIPLNEKIKFSQRNWVMLFAKVLFLNGPTVKPQLMVFFFSSSSGFKMQNSWIMASFFLVLKMSSLIFFCGVEWINSGATSCSQNIVKLFMLCNCLNINHFALWYVFVLVVSK